MRALGQDKIRQGLMQMQSMPNVKMLLPIFCDFLPPTVTSVPSEHENLSS